MTHDTSEPLLKRIKINTVAAPDIGEVEAWYTEWLGYSVCERGKTSAALADAWGAPAMGGRPQTVLRPESGDDVFIRICQIDPVAGYRPMNSLGWNAFELIVDDVYPLYEKLKGSPFGIIGTPASLGGELDFIHAMQVQGPAGDVLYLTCDRLRAADTLLPPPGAFVGRPFIAVLAAHGVDDIQRWYSETFRMQREADMRTAIGVVARAQGLPPEHCFDMGFMALGESGHFIEYDGYDPSIGARPANAEQLPPGCAMVSFAVDGIDDLDLDYLGPAVEDGSVVYGGGPCRTARGPAGELIELVSER